MWTILLRQGNGNIANEVLLGASEKCKNNLQWLEFNRGRDEDGEKDLKCFWRKAENRKGMMILREENESVDVIFLQIRNRNPHFISLLPNEPVNSCWNSLHKWCLFVHFVLTGSAGKPLGFEDQCSPTLSGCLPVKMVRMCEIVLTGLLPEKVLSPRGYWLCTLAQQ